MDADRAQKYARITGVLFVVTLLAGGFGESYVPNTLLVANDLAGTAHRMAASASLFRASFAAYLVEATCDISLTVLLYLLLRPVNRTLSLLAACFGIISTATFATAEIFYFAAALPALDSNVARVIPPDAEATLTYLCLTIYGYVFGGFAVFYGTAAMIRGLLIYRSGYLPRALGAILIAGGLSFITQNFLLLLAPKYNLPYVVAPMMLAMISLAIWMLAKGIDSSRWKNTFTIEAD